jgi:hypothetical protein
MARPGHDPGRWPPAHGAHGEGIDMRDEHRERLTATMARMSTPVLVAALLELEAKGYDVRTPEERMARTWLIDELEDRFPEASAAVGAAFEHAEELDPGDPRSEVDYVAVLVAHLPA